MNPAQTPTEPDGGRKILLKLMKRELPRVPPEDAEDGKFNLSDNKQAASFRRRRAGMLDANGNSLSHLRITGSNERQVTMGPVTSVEMQVCDPMILSNNLHPRTAPAHPATELCSLALF